jgi:hypothetical protein
MSADTPIAPAAGGITSPDYWEARWKQARADAAADTALAINGPEGHTASEWHSGRFRFNMLSCTFRPSGSGLVGAMAWSDTNQNIPANTDTALIFQQTEWDTDTCFSLSTPTILICHTAGVYAVTGYAQLVASTPGANFTLELIVEKNTPLSGWVPIARNSVGLLPVDNPACSVSAPPRSFLVGDLVRLRLNHSSTVTEHTHVSTYSSGTKPVEPPQLALWKIGDA